MKNRILLTSIACMFCIGLLAAPFTLAAAEPLPRSGALQPAPALELMRTLGDKLTVVDVRTEAEYLEGHIPGALLAPLQTLENSLERIPTDRPVLLVCHTGLRAKTAYEIIRRARPDHSQLWFLQGRPEYKPDGSFTFN